MITDKLPTLKGLILDMDGVLWHDNEPIGELPAIFNQIRALGLKFVLATNNSTKTIDEYLQKLSGFGVLLEAWQIVTSAESTLDYLQETSPNADTLYIFGSNSLKESARQRGYNVLEDDDATTKADYVLVGLDVNLTYNKISNAAKKIREGATFIATNTDATFPAPQGLIPGAGTMVTAVQTASGTKPTTIGKPEPYLYRSAIKVMNLEPKDVLCVGDRLDTDILGAQNAGFQSALVLSGVSTPEDLDRWNPKPNLVASDLTALIYD